MEGEEGGALHFLPMHFVRECAVLAECTMLKAGGNCHAVRGTDPAYGQLEEVTSLLREKERALNKLHKVSSSAFALKARCAVLTYLFRHQEHKRLQVSQRLSVQCAGLVTSPLVKSAFVCDVWYCGCAQMCVAVRRAVLNTE